MVADLKFELRTYGGTVTRRRLARIESRARRPREMFMEAYGRFRELMQIHFSREGSGPSGPWAELKPNTVARKARMGLDPRILHATLKLRPSLTSRGVRYAVFRTSGETVIFGTSHPASGMLQRGTKHMVARPPIDLHEQDKREIVESMREFLLQ